MMLIRYGNEPNEDLRYVRSLAQDVSAAPTERAAFHGLDDEQLGRSFYRGIAPIDWFPEPNRPADDTSELVIGSIIDNVTIAIKGLTVKLRDHQLYIFNALAYLRNLDWLSASDIMRFGYYPDASTQITRKDAFSAHMQSLAKRLDLPEQKIILAKGEAKKRRYQLLPAFQIEDERTGDQAGFERQATLYQTIASRLASLPHTTIVAPSLIREQTEHVTITGNKTVRTRQGEVELNEHELCLLNLFLLTSEQVLTFEEIEALGFHMYNRGGQGWQSALYRTVHSLGQTFAQFGGGQGQFVLEAGFKTSLVRATTKLHFRDSRSKRPNEYERLAGVCTDILKEVRESEQITPIAPVSYDRVNTGVEDQKAIDPRIVEAAFASGAITLREAVTLSLRTGKHYTSLEGTVLPTLSGPQSYAQLFSHVAEHGPLSQRYTGALFGLSGHGADFIQEQALQRMHLEMDKRRAEEPFVLESPPSAAKPVASSVRGLGVFATGTSGRQPGESTHGLPPEQAKQPAPHLSDGPGEWTPAVAKVTPSMIFSRTESLTATQICARLGIPAEEADATIAAALERIDPGDVAPKHIALEDGSMVTVYSGSLLLALRQQLTGIPLEYVAVALNLNKEKLGRAIKYLQDHKYRVFDDRISPGAFALLSNDPARATAAPTE